MYIIGCVYIGVNQIYTGLGVNLVIWLLVSLMYIVGCVCVCVNKIGTVLWVNLVIGYWSLSNVYNWLCVCWC